MSKIAPYQDLESVFSKLVAVLSTNWSQSDIQCVQNYISHAEYGEALENLVAIGQQKDQSFTAGQTSMIADLAAEMQMPNPLSIRFLKSA